MVETDNVARLLFVGSPLLDIYARCDQKSLQQFGLQEDGCVRAKEEHDLLFRDFFHRPDSRLSAGGSALNAARIAKWVLGTKGDVAFSGSAGCDDYAKWISNQLQIESVLPLLINNPDQKTGVCMCLTCNGMRSMCTRLGAAATFSKEHLFQNNIYRKLKTANCIFVVGYFLGHSPDVVFTLAEHCSRNQVFSLSLSAEYICRDYSEALRKVMPRVDVLFGNEAEVKAFARTLGGNDISTVEEAIKVIRKLPRITDLQPRILVVTQGSDPVIVDDGSTNSRIFEVPKDVDVVDSVGCGDALTGAFLATFILNRDLDLSVTAGIQAAVQILQVHGCDTCQLKS